MGVLTHLDGFKDQKKLKKTKKALKHRFWAEIYQGQLFTAHSCAVLASMLVPSIAELLVSAPMSALSHHSWLTNL